LLEYGWTSTIYNIELYFELTKHVLGLSFDWSKEKKVEDPQNLSVMKIKTEWNDQQNLPLSF